MRVCPRLAGTAALALALAACGGDAASRQQRRPTTQSQRDPADLEAELTWWDTSDPTNEGPAFKELITKFNETYPNVTINYQSVPFDEAQNKFKTAAAGRLRCARTSCAPRWPGCRSSPRSATSTPSTARALLEDEPTSSRPRCRRNVYDGKTYGVPQVTDIARPDVQQEAVREGRHRRAPDHVGRGDDGRDRRSRQKTGADGLYINAGRLLPAAVHLRRGRRPGRHRGQEDHRQLRARTSRASQIAQDLVKSGAAVKPDANDSYGTMMTLFKEGKVGMIINGPWEVANVRTPPSVRRLREPRRRPGPGRLRQGRARRSAATTTSSTPAWTRTRPTRPSRS